MTERSPQRLRENPGTPLSSGLERAQMQATILAEIASSSPRPPVAVEIGCGDGMATAVTATLCEPTPGTNVTIIGLDWSCAALDLARRRGVPMVRAVIDGSGLPLASGIVDVVIMSELIEHLVDTDVALTEAGRVLVPGGSLLLSTPNLAAWCKRVILALEVQPLFNEVGLRSIYGRPGREVVGRLRVFTCRALEELLASAGFVERTPSLSSILLASARWPT